MTTVNHGDIIINITKVYIIWAQKEEQRKLGRAKIEREMEGKWVKNDDGGAVC